MGRRRLLLKPFVRTLLVVFVAGGVEVPLLGGAIRAHRLDRLPLERAMHPLVRPVVRANRDRQPDRAEGAFEHGPRCDRLGGEQPMTTEQKLGVLIGDREGITVPAIARAELPFDVGRPEIVRDGRDGPHDARLYRRPPAAAPVHQLVARQLSGSIRQLGRRIVPGLGTVLRVAAYVLICPAPAYLPPQVGIVLSYGQFRASSDMPA